MPTAESLTLAPVGLFSSRAVAAQLKAVPFPFVLNSGVFAQSVNSYPIALAVRAQDCRWRGFSRRQDQVCLGPTSPTRKRAAEPSAFRAFRCVVVPRLSGGLRPLRVCGDVAPST